MKKRILCFILVLAMLLPMQVFAAGGGDEGSNQKDTLKASSDKYLTILGVTLPASAEHYYSSLSEIPESILFFKFQNGIQYGGIIPLVRVDVYPDNLPSFRYKATYRGTIVEQT